MALSANIGRLLGKLWFWSGNACGSVPSMAANWTILKASSAYGG